MMTQELWHTSAVRGLKPGTRGFCTVVATQGMPVNLAERLELLSGYRHLEPPRPDRSDANPVAWNHVRLTVGGRLWHVLSRIGSAGLDYSGRSNKFAHHVALEPKDLPPAGPAWLLAQPGFMETQWDGQLRLLPAGRKVPQGQVEPAPCQAWAQVAGDAGWAGWLAENVLAQGSAPRIVNIIVPRGTDVLKLLAEAVALLPPERRWEATFSTFYVPMPGDVDCRWRTLFDNTPEASAARRQRGAWCLDLTRPLPAPEETPGVLAARQGKPILPEPLPSPAAVAEANTVAIPAAAGTWRLDALEQKPPPLVVPPPLASLRTEVAEPVLGRPRRRRWLLATAAGLALILLLSATAIGIAWWLAPGAKERLLALRTPEPVAKPADAEPQPAAPGARPQPPASVPPQPRAATPHRAPIETPKASPEEAKRAERSTSPSPRPRKTWLQTLAVALQIDWLKAVARQFTHNAQNVGREAVGKARKFLSSAVAPREPPNVGDMPLAKAAPEGSKPESASPPKTLKPSTARRSQWCHWPDAPLTAGAKKPSLLWRPDTPHLIDLRLIPLVTQPDLTIKREAEGKAAWNVMSQTKILAGTTLQVCGRLYVEGGNLLCSDISTEGSQKLPWYILLARHSDEQGSTIPIQFAIPRKTDSVHLEVNQRALPIKQPLDIGTEKPAVSPRVSLYIDTREAFLGTFMQNEGDAVNGYGSNRSTISVVFKHKRSSGNSDRNVQTCVYSVQKPPTPPSGGLSDVEYSLTITWGLSDLAFSAKREPAAGTVPPRRQTPRALKQRSAKTLSYITIRQGRVYLEVEGYRLTLVEIGQHYDPQ